MPTYRLLLIEDDATLRQQLCADLNADDRLEVVGEADSWNSAEDLLQNADFDLALLDLRLGERLTQDLIGPACARGHVVVYSVYGDEGAVVAALAAGASGYLHKEAPSIDMANTLVEVMQGLVPISPTVAGHLLTIARKTTEGQPNQDSGWQLTDRELEILEWLARGLTYRQVGEKCHITFNTVAFHVKQIYEKLQVSSRSAAVFQALSSGLIRLQE